MPSVILSVRPSVCLSLCPSHAFLWQNQIVHCEYFDTVRKDNHSSFLTPTVVGGWRSLPSEICAQSNPPPSKSRLRQISTYNVSTVTGSEKVQSWRIGNQTRAFQRAIDGVRTLPLSLPKGDSKVIFCSFKTKFNFNRIRSTTKFLYVKTINGKVVARPFPYLTVHRYWHET